MEAAAVAAPPHLGTRMSGSIYIVTAEYRTVHVFNRADTAADAEAIAQARRHEGARAVFVHTADRSLVSAQALAARARRERTGPGRGLARGPGRGSAGL